MKHFNIIAGRVMRQKRRNAKKTQEEVAKPLGIVRQAIANIETGRNGMDLEMFYQMCKEIGCDPYKTLSDIYAATEGGTR